MKKIMAICMLVGVAWFVSGCKTPDIVVTDTAGNPIEGAVVMGTSLSISGQKTETDKNGFAKIPSAVQETKWISVAKTGYVTIGNVDVNQKKPIKIMLKKK